ncbi:MAG TPA: TonB family protein [Gemmatimonadaceae bacterium]|nr:TonB family protein [Gemmatimonadaceae bacterium]
MIAAWMLYAAAIGALIGLATLIGERAARALRSPIRMVWAAGSAVTLLGPAVAYDAAIHRSAAPVGGVEATTLVPTTGDAHIQARPHGRFALLEARLLPVLHAVAADLDRPLLVAWAVVSLLLLARLAASVARLRSRQRLWTARDVDGITVLISPDVGPAVVGLRAMHIVMPEWSLALEAPLRAVVLRHESEHRRAGDPYLLAFAALARALAPWNLALWWQARRLRLAIEIDCDARVLRDDPQVDRYGNLLLAIAQRGTARVPAAVAALAESPSDLERRIEAMTKPSRRSRMIALCCAGAAAIAVAFACEAPIPSVPARSKAAPSAPTSTVPVRAAAPPAAGWTRANPCRDASVTGHARSTPISVPNPQPAFYYDCEVDTKASAAEGNIPPAYPAALRLANVEGMVRIRFVIDANGRADTTSFTPVVSSNPLFTEAVIARLPAMRFIPARLHGAKVAQAVEMPFVFTLLNGSASAPPGRGAAGASTSTNAGGAGTVYSEYQVEKKASVMEGNQPPAYPKALRAANVEGEVLVSFVVEANGRADMSTFKVVKTTQDLFTDAVRSHLPDMTFSPAEIAGHAVRQRVEMPFVFTLGRS